MLDLSHNFLSGSLSLRSSSTLQYLHLEENMFSGSIPKAFLNISKLLTLDISNNRLSGNIPSAIDKALNLRILLLRGNRMSGTIPTQLCQLIKINFMDLSRNFISGTIPHCFPHIIPKEILNFRLFLGIEFGSINIDIYEPFENCVQQDEAIFVTKHRLST